MSLRPRTDVELLREWGAGERAAGSELIDRYFAVVHRFLKNKVSDDLDDLIQQIFLCCLESWPRYREESSFKTFLLGIARNQLYSHYRRRKHPQREGERELTLRDPRTSPSGQLARDERERVLLRAMRELPLEAQVILELVYWEDLSGAEIARVLEIPINTTYSRMHRAKLLLRKRLRQTAPDLLDVAPPRLCGGVDKYYDGFDVRRLP